MKNGSIEIKITNIKESVLEEGYMIEAECHVEISKVSSKGMGAVMAQLFKDLADQCDDKTEYLKTFAKRLDNLIEE